MKAVILNGSQRRPVAEATEALGSALNALRLNALHDVVLCLPPDSDEIREFCMLTYPELFYRFVEVGGDEPVGTSYSLFLAREHLKPITDTFLIHQNVVFEPRLLSRLVEFPGSCIATERGIFDGETYSVSVHQGRVLSLSTDQFLEESCGRSIGICKLRAEAMPWLMRELTRNAPHFDERLLPFEMLLDRLFLNGSLQGYPCYIDGLNWRWTDRPRRKRRKNLPRYERRLRL